MKASKQTNKQIDNKKRGHVSDQVKINTPIATKTEKKTETHLPNKPKTRNKKSIHFDLFAVIGGVVVIFFKKAKI